MRGGTDDDRVSVQIGCITSTPLNLNSHHHHNWVEEAKKTTCSNATATTTTEGFQLLLLLLEVAKSYLVLNLLYYQINPLLEELILVAIVYNLSDTKIRIIFLLAWDFLGKLILMDIFQDLCWKENDLCKSHFELWLSFICFHITITKKIICLIRLINLHI